jgi:predicted nucleotidyltransferase
MDTSSEIQLERQQRADDITARLKACAAEVLAKFPVEIAYLHGSVARGCPLPTSDVDVAVLLAELPPPYDRLRLEFDIQAALEDACGLSNLDVRAINEAPLMVQGNIVQEGVLLYNRDKDQRVAFEVLTRKRYFDFQPAAKRLQQAYFNRIRREGLLRGKSKHHRIDLK